MRDVSPEAPMDGFTAFLKSPLPGRDAANHQPHPFMNNATQQRDSCPSMSNAIEIYR